MLPLICWSGRRDRCAAILDGLPLIRRMIRSGCREMMQGVEVVAMDPPDDSERVPSAVIWWRVP